ncbi:hypothetical protein [Brucella intermedia]|uniref:hypothetical protein n=1 Tax=Brucella intermedia TaxID=94625 RepID=UPI0024476769|nr:hypothetical protein [Brucella intermedia]WGG61822.1 hypothetical protein QA414_14980 [Brucella intermedia]
MTVMASERDREIWDDATNAVCQAMQEQKMCNCPDGDCLAAKIDFSPEKIATATRPAPAATDTGLVTFSVEVTSSGHPYMKSDPDGDYVTRSQAVELLAAEQEKALFLKTAMEIAQTHCGLKDKTIDSLEADNAALTARVKELEHSERVKGVNTQYANALANLGMTEDDEAEPFADTIIEKLEALEAKLAAAEKALEPFVSFFNEAMKGFTEGYAERTPFDKPVFGWNNAYLLMQHFIEARAALGGKPS